MTGPQIARLTVEHDARSVVATAAPRLSWQTVTDTPEWLQSQYELRIASSDGDSYSTDWVESGESVLVPWPAPALTSREERTVEVRVRGVDGSMSEWSDPLPVVAGLLLAEDWHATFVGPAWDEDLESPQPCSVPPARLRDHAAGDGCAPVRDRARRLRARAQRRARRRPRARARLDELPPPAALRHLRRHRAAASRARTSSARMLGDGWYRGALVEQRARGTSTATGWVCSASSS